MELDVFAQDAERQPRAGADGDRNGEVGGHGKNQRCEEQRAIA